MRTQRFWRARKLLWFILSSLFLGTLVMLLTGSLLLERGVRAGASLNDFRAHLDRRVPALLKRYQIPGCSLALVQDSEMVWVGAYGYADLDRGRLLTTDTPMRVQSISKSVTAWAVVKLVESGSIELDAPVSQYLKSWQFPESPYSAEEVTIRRLLSHTAGVPLGDVFTLYAPGQEMPSLREKLTQEAVLTRKPGTAYSYSNTGYNLLELLIEETTGRDFAEYMQSEILLPLGMRSASFDWNESMTPPPPVGYSLSGESIPIYVYPEKASGGLFATAEDIARFAMAGMRDNPVLSADSVAQLYSPVTHDIGIYGVVFDAYGFGHFIETLPNGARSVSHGGQGSGIMTHMQAVPESGDAIVILTNSQRSWPFIAYLLNDWAHWRGFPTVGMGKIVWGRYGLSAIVGMLLSASLLLCFRPIMTFYRRKRDNGNAKPRRTHWIRIAISFALLGILAWSVSQKYLFLTSVFPILSVWLGFATLAFAMALLLSAVSSCAFLERSGRTKGPHSHDRMRTRNGAEKCRSLRP